MKPIENTQNQYMQNPKQIQIDRKHQQILQHISKKLLSPKTTTCVHKKKKAQNAKKKSTTKIQKKNNKTASKSNT